MRSRHLYVNVLSQTLSDALAAKQLGGDDADVLASTVQYLQRLEAIEKEPDEATWDSFLSFWPPRLLAALASERLLCFFGAGLSIPSGLPAWGDLLRDYFGLDAALLLDDEAASDPLTQAELAAHRLGAEDVQAVLRRQLGAPRLSSTTHMLASRCGGRRRSHPPA